MTGRAGLNESMKKAMYLETNITIIDDRRVEIENCKKITEYNDVCVRIKTSGRNVSVWGTALSMSDFKTGGLVIEGKISSVEFE